MMASALISIVVMTACSGALGQCRGIKASATPGSRSVAVGDFSGIDVSGQIDVRLSQGQQASVVLSGPKNLLEYITAEVKDGVLHLSHKDGVQFEYDDDASKIVATVTTPEITMLDVSGQSGLVTATAIEAKELTVEVGGQSELKLAYPVTATGFTATVKGQSDFDMTGCNARSMSVNVSGQSDADLKGEYVADAMRLNASGQSEIEVDGNVAAKLMDVSTSGQSDFGMKGNVTADRGVFNASGQSDIKLDNGEIKSLSSRTSGQAEVKLGKVNSQYPTVEE